MQASSSFAFLCALCDESLLLLLLCGSQIEAEHLGLVPDDELRAAQAQRAPDFPAAKQATDLADLLVAVRRELHQVQRAAFAIDDV